MISDPVQPMGGIVMDAPDEIAQPNAPAEPAPKLESVDLGISARETYNIVTDLAVGPNVRLRDNVFQAISIFVCLVLGALVGVVVASDARIAGALVGGFLGLVAGLFLSGIFLMIYRFVQHARGKHG